MKKKPSSKTAQDFCQTHLDRMRQLQTKFVKVSVHEFDFYLGIKIFSDLTFKQDFLSQPVGSLANGKYKDMKTYLEKNFWQVVKDESDTVIDLHPDSDTCAPEVFKTIAPGIAEGDMILIDDLDRYWKVSFKNNQAYFYKQVEEPIARDAI